MIMDEKNWFAGPTADLIEHGITTQTLRRSFNHSSAVIMPAQFDRLARCDKISLIVVRQQR